MKTISLRSIVSRCAAIIAANEQAFALTVRPAASAGAAAIASVANNAEKAAKGKEPNYTAEQTTALVAAYKAGATTDALATQFGKSKRSIVAKLTREQVYQKEGYKTKSGGEVISKEEIVTKIATIMGVSDDKLGGLEKANKSCLLLLADALGEVAAMLDAGASIEADQELSEEAYAAQVEAEQAQAEKDDAEYEKSIMLGNEKYTVGDTEDEQF